MILSTIELLINDSKELKCYCSLAPFAKAHLRCFPLLRSSFLLIKWRSLRALLSSDFRASTESELRRARVNCNNYIPVPSEMQCG